MPGPASVIETPLLVGWCGKKEQTGHPSQKPIKSLEPLILMTTKEGDVVLDPMCGSGTLNVEASLIGIDSVGIGKSPFCVLMSKVKYEALKMVKVINERQNIIDLVFDKQVFVGR